MALRCTPVQPHATGGDVAFPGDETSAGRLPTAELVVKAFLETRGEFLVLIAKGIGEEIDTCQVSAVSFSEGK